MSAIPFVHSLLEAGRVHVPMRVEPPEDLEAAVAELDRAARPHMPFEAPALSPAAAGWALTVLYRGCQSLVYREIDAGAVRDALSRPCPREPSPEVCYSVDLSFRYLPDLLALARGIARDDPLVLGLMELARRWPLSSVGVAGVADASDGDGEIAGVSDLSAFVHHPSLRQLYVDRVIEKEDVARLGHPIVRDAVREALGALPELSPKLAAALEKGAGAAEA